MLYTRTDVPDVWQNAHCLRACVVGVKTECAGAFLWASMQHCKHIVALSHHPPIMHLGPKQHLSYMEEGDLPYMEGGPLAIPTKVEGKYAAGMPGK